MLETRIIICLQRLIASKALAPVRLSDDGGWYAYKEAALLISERLNASGASESETLCSIQRLSAALRAYKMAGRGERRSINQRQAFLVRYDALHSLISRLSERMNTDLE